MATVSLLPILKGWPIHATVIAISGRCHAPKRRKPGKPGGVRLTRVGKFDNLSDMKRISAREFQKRFGQIAGAMREGQAVEVTMHGKPIGRFTKNRRRRMKLPDFVSLLESESCSKELGNRILKEFHDSLS